MAGVGSSLTGQPDDESQSLKDIVNPSSAADNPMYKALFADPNSRSALLQIGLNLMQPQAMGQSASGHIGQAVGEGGEAVGRIEEEELKQKQADDKLAIAQARMDRMRDPNVMTPYQQQELGLRSRAQGFAERRANIADTREERQAKAEQNKAIQKEVEAAVEARDSLVLPDKHPEKLRWADKTDKQIRDIIAAEHAGAPSAETPAPAAGGAQPKTVIQNGHTYTLGADGKYH
jgi:hypothetical protein